MDNSQDNHILLIHPSAPPDIYEYLEGENPQFIIKNRELLWPIKIILMVVFFIVLYFGWGWGDLNFSHIDLEAIGFLLLRNFFIMVVSLMIIAFYIGVEMNSIFWLTATDKYFGAYFNKNCILFKWSDGMNVSLAHGKNNKDTVCLTLRNNAVPINKNVSANLFAKLGYSIFNLKFEQKPFSFFITLPPAVATLVMAICQQHIKKKHQAAVIMMEQEEKEDEKPII